MASSGKKLFCFGYGYTAGYLADILRPLGWRISGTTTDPGKQEHLEKSGIEAVVFEDNHPLTDPYETLDGVTHVLLSIPPGDKGDPAFSPHGFDIAGIKTLEWVGYLSTTGVYGNRDGNWVDETSPPAPDSRRGSLRLKAEEQWQSLLIHEDLPLHIFRLAGIYGPGRCALDSVRTGTARRIDKPGHVFNRIHVEDIAQVLVASIGKPSPGEIYNLADDLPAASHDVISFACDITGTEPPPMTPFEQAEMAPIVRSFYKDNKRIRNNKIKEHLGVTLKYPDYRAGLQACLHTEKKA